MQQVHFQVRVGVFSCQQILTKISFVIFDIMVKKKTNRKWFSAVCTLFDNDTRHHSGQNLLWIHSLRVMTGATFQQLPAWLTKQEH